MDDFSILFRILRDQEDSFKWDNVTGFNEERIIDEGRSSDVVKLFGMNRVPFNWLTHAAIPISRISAPPCPGGKKYIRQRPGTLPRFDEVDKEDEEDEEDENETFSKPSNVAFAAGNDLESSFVGCVTNSVTPLFNTDANSVPNASTTCLSVVFVPSSGDNEEEEIEDDVLLVWKSDNNVDHTCSKSQSMVIIVLWSRTGVCRL